MMFNRFKSGKFNEKIRARVLNRLRNTTSQEVMLWMDNCFTGTGKAMQDMQKSLRQNNPEQALVFIEEIRNGCLSILAAAQVIEERVTE